MLLLRTSSSPYILGRIPDPFIKYLSKYTKRPVIAESRILSCTEKEVTFEYLDKKAKIKKILIMPIRIFLKRLLRHIPDINYRMIRQMFLKISDVLRC